MLVGEKNTPLSLSLSFYHTHTYTHRVHEKQACLFTKHVKAYEKDQQKQEVLCIMEIPEH